MVKVPHNVMGSACLSVSVGSLFQNMLYPKCARLYQGVALQLRRGIEVRRIEALVDLSTMMPSANKAVLASAISGTIFTGSRFVRRTFLGYEFQCSAQLEFQCFGAAALK